MTNSELQNFVNANLTLHDLYLTSKEIELDYTIEDLLKCVTIEDFLYLESKKVGLNYVVEDILKCTTIEDFDQSKLPILESTEKEQSSFKNLFLPESYALNFLMMLEKSKSFHLKDIFIIFETSEYPEYIEISKKLTLKQIIAHINYVDKNNIEKQNKDIEKQNKANEILNINKIKQEFLNITTENELITFLNSYNITAKILLTYTEDDMRGLEDRSDFPFNISPEIFSELQNFVMEIVNDFFKFMNYTITYQIIHPYTLISSINFIAILNFEKLNSKLTIGSIGELQCSTDYNDDCQENNIELGEFYKLKKKKIELEVWECIKDEES